MRSKLMVVGLTAALAFLLATNPVVVEAAGQITSGDIKNNTIKGKDVKDGSLVGADIAADSLTGGDVQEATLAGVNASTLNGQPPTSYLNTTYTFTLPITAASSSKNFTAAVPAGTYLASYNVISTGSGPRCRLHSRSDVFVSGLGWADGYQGPIGTAFFASSTAVLTVPAGQTPRLTCEAGGVFALYAGSDGTSSMSFTKIDTAVAGAATGGRQESSARPGGLG